MASQQAKPGGPQQPPPAAAGAQQQQQPGWNPMAMFQPFGQTVEQHIERGLDVVMGPADEEHLAAGRRKEKRRKKKRSEKEDKIPPVNFEREVAEKASELAERMRREEADLEESLRRRKEAALENYRSIVQSTLVQVGGLYAVSQACLLSLFVPQKCPVVIPCTPTPVYGCGGVKLSTLPIADRADAAANVTSCCVTSRFFDYPTYLPDGHLCSMKENIDWDNDSDFNRAVLLINIVTLVVMLAAQSYFWKREVWMINHLEEDNTVPYSSLPEQIKPYDELRKQNTTYNGGAYAYAATVTVCIMINFIISAVFVLKGDGTYNYNIGSRTVTGLLTNTMLVSTKIIGYFSYSRLSKTNDWAISMFSVIPVSYNCVDENYKIHHAKPDEDLAKEEDVA